MVGSVVERSTTGAGAGPVEVLPGTVTLVLVSHDGAAWLPQVIDGVLAQTAPLTRVVAVDTGSRDAGPDLLETRLAPVVSAPATAGFASAVALGLEHARTLGPPSEWVWLLHDDARPDPGALAALLAAAEAHPSADVLGPKVREWPSLLRLVEVGVTIGGTGGRETGLEPGEYDQGQHDDVRTVLAVGTAGMLVRRRVLEQLGGFEEQLPVFGHDVDFGWRVAAAGLRTVVVPDAVVFHAEAARRGLRRTPLTGSHTHAQERRASLFTLLANSRPGALWLQVPRLVVGTLLRVLGLLVVREPARALDDVAALVSVLAQPRALARARRERAAARVTGGVDVRRLLAPWWTPYRHGLDLVVDLGGALTQQATDVAERRRAAAAGRDPSSFAARRVERDATAAEEAAHDTGVVARFVTNPVAVLLAVVVLVALVGSRHALGSVSGGGLSPAPGSAHDWWTLHLQSRHALAQGTSVPAPAYLLPLALLGFVLGGSATAAVSVVLLTCVPVALWGAWRFLRVLGRLVSVQGVPRWLVLWGATTYAVTPVASGAWGDGRLGPVVAAALLPWLAHAVLGFADPEADRRWRAAWRGGLLLSVVVAFVPPLWWLVLVLVVAVLVAGFVAVPGGMRKRSVWGPLAVLVATPPVLLAPWWLASVIHGGAAALLLDVGRLPGAGVDGWSLVAGRLDGLGAPRWAGLVLVALAVAALLPRRSRLGVTLCWVVAALAAVTGAALAAVTVDLAAVSTSGGATAAVVVLQGAWVAAVVLGAHAVGTASTGGASTRRRGRSVVVRVGAGVLVLVGLVPPLVGLGWFVADPHLTIADGRDDGIPAYMVQDAGQDSGRGILVVRGTSASGLTYTVRRGDGTTLGEDEVIALTAEDRELTRDVQSLASRPTPRAVAALADDGIAYVVLPAPADVGVAAALDATAGLSRASAEDRRTRAWQVETTASPDQRVVGRRSWSRTVAVALQLVAVLVVVVLCLPTRLASRRRPA